MLSRPNGAQWKEEIGVLISLYNLFNFAKPVFWALYSLV